MMFGCEIKSTKDRSYGYGSYTKRFTKKLGESSIRKGLIAQFNGQNNSNYFLVLNL